MPFNYVEAPKILFEPGFALTMNDLRARFQGKTKISADSTIILGSKAAGPIENLTIDGFLKADAPVSFFDHFRSEKIRWQSINEHDPEALRIRGYKVIAHNDE